jgi:CHAT domain-containing protein/predicted negative regulator of RcsB-dependent stress response
MRNIVLLFTISSILAIMPAYGQRKAKVDTVAAFRALEEGNRLQQEAKYDSSMTYYQLAAAGYQAYALSLPPKPKWNHHRELGWLSYNKAMTSLANTYIREGQLTLAHQTFEQSANNCAAQLGINHLQVAHIYRNWSSTAIRLGQIEGALEMNNTALKIYRQQLDSNAITIASTLNAIGYCYNELGDYDTAIRLYQQALSIYQSQLPQNHIQFGYINANMGITAGNLGEGQRSLAYLHTAKNIFLTHYKPHDKEMAQIYNLLGNNSKKIGDTTSALSYYRQAINILVPIQPVMQGLLADIYHNQANVYADNLNYRKGLEILKGQVLPIRLRQAAVDPLSLAKCYHNLANYATRLRQFDQARVYNQQSIQIRHQTLGKYHSLIGSNYSIASEIHFANHQIDSALIAIEAGLCAFSPAYDASKDYATLPYNDYNILTYLLSSKIQYLLHRQNHSDDSLAQLTLQQADRMCDSLKRSFAFEDDKLNLTDHTIKLYGLGVQLAERLQDRNLLYYYSEKSKATVLASLLNEAHAYKMANLPDSVLAQDKRLRHQLARTRKQYDETNSACPDCDSTRLALKLSEFQHAQQTHFTFSRMLEQQYPQFSNLKYPNTTYHVGALQSGLLRDQPNTAILIYTLTDSTLYSQLLTQRQHLTHQQSLYHPTFKSSAHSTFNFYQDIQQVEKALKQLQYSLSSPQYLTEPAQRLYRWLIQPFESVIAGKDLLVIPDKQLYNVPFEILVKSTQPIPNGAPPGPEITTTAGHQAWQQVPFLLKDHNISYHYSATLLAQEWTYHQQNLITSTGLMGVAPVFTQQSASTSQLLAQRMTTGDSSSASVVTVSERISALPASEHEVLNISALFKAHQLPALTLLHEQATKANTLHQQLKSYRYLHFATHGLIDEERPTQSCLILAPNHKLPKLPSPSGEGPGVGNPSPKGEGSFDNLLTSSEMYGLELDAELVVLSACQTGKGTLKAGEGIIGLTRGLLYAGARNLMVSQWNVNDASTAELMTKFYSKILSGQSNRQALREAKLELLNSKFACPHYWSAFVLVGR